MNRKAQVRRDTWLKETVCFVSPEQLQPTINVAKLFFVYMDGMPQSSVTDLNLVLALLG